MTATTDSAQERLFDHLKDIEEGLTGIYQKLAQATLPEPDEIQREIASAVVLLYGLRQDHRTDLAANQRHEPHAIVFSGRVHNGWKGQILGEMVAKASCGGLGV